METTGTPGPRRPRATISPPFQAGLSPNGLFPIEMPGLARPVLTDQCGLDDGQPIRGPERRTSQPTVFKKGVAMKKFVALLALLMVGALSGCNTMQGLGKDIERGGEKLQNSAKDVRDGK
jgi:predicted small secreted protein